MTKNEHDNRYIDGIEKKQNVHNIFLIFVRYLQTIFCAKWQNFVSCFSRLGERCIGVAYKEI